MFSLAPHHHCCSCRCEIHFDFHFYFFTNLTHDRSTYILSDVLLMANFNDPLTIFSGEGVLWTLLDITFYLLIAYQFFFQPFALLCLYVSSLSDDYLNNYTTTLSADMSRTSFEWIDREMKSARLALELTPWLHEGLTAFCTDFGIYMRNFFRLSILNMLNKMEWVHHCYLYTSL